MMPNEALRREACKWLREAAKDLHSARFCSRLKIPSHPGLCFTASRQAEKAANASLALRNTPFRKTHDLVQLGLQCGDLDPALAPLLTEAADLTDYASAFRYPDAPYQPDVGEAARALEIAERVFAEVGLRVEIDRGSES